MTMAAPQKSPYGKPCSGCGICCQEELCPLGVHVFGAEEGPCPALKFDATGESFCGLVRSPRKYAPVKTAIHGATAMSNAALHIIGAGHNCDALAVDEPDDPAAQRRMIAECEAGVSRTVESWKMWGI